MPDIAEKSKLINSTVHEYIKSLGPLEKLDIKAAHELQENYLQKPNQRLRYAS